MAQGVEDAVAAAAAPADPANGLAEVASGSPSVHGPSAPDRELLVDHALAHVELMRREYPAIVARESYHRFVRTRARRLRGDEFPRACAPSRCVTRVTSCGPRLI